MSTQIVNHQKISTKAKTHTVQKDGFGHWLVTSGNSGIIYHVRLKPISSCTCSWAKGRGRQAVACSHVKAVVDFVSRDRGYNATMRPEDAPTAHLHRKEYEIGDNSKFTFRKVMA